MEPLLVEENPYYLLHSSQYICLLVVVFSFYWVGGLIFRHYAFIKMAVLLGVFGLLLLLYCLSFLETGSLPRHVLHTVSVVPVVAGYVFAGVNMVIAYYRLKDTDVV